MSSLFLSFLISNTLGASIYNGCKFDLTDSNGMTAEYDLNYFKVVNGAFKVVDSLNPYFYYVFDICSSLEASEFTDASTIPSACAHPQNNHGPCVDIVQNANNSVATCKSFENTAGELPSAVQVDTINNETACYWLGMEVQSQPVDEYKIELLREDDAGKGVVYTILNGEWCASKGINRELRIKLECPDDPRIEFDPAAINGFIQAETVTEIDTCIYELAVVSPLACPNKCISRMNWEMYSVCGAHGICAADPFGNGESNYPNGTLRCLCDEGYGGDFCENKVSEVKVIDQTHPGLLGAIIVCILLLGVAIVCAAVLCHKIRMKQIEESQSMGHLSGGMLNDANDRRLEQTKVDAMTMDIGSGNVGGVQLQSVDTMIESDKNKNELLDDDENDKNTQNQIVEKEQEQATTDVIPGGNDNNDGIIEQ